MFNRVILVWAMALVLLIGISSCIYPAKRKALPEKTAESLVIKRSR